MATTLMGDWAKQVLASGGGLRMSCKKLSVSAMEEYAAWAASGKARLEFVVGDEALLPDAMTRIAAFGKGYVLFDFVTRPG